MTYYLTATSPLVFTTQKAERVTESMIRNMLKELLKREYENYLTEEARSNLLYWLRMDEVFSGYPTPPNPKNEELPTEKELESWVNEFLYFTSAGKKLLSMRGAKLHQQNPEEEDDQWPLEEWTLSDMLESLTYPSEWDSEGPELHSQFSNPIKNED